VKKKKKKLIGEVSSQGLDLPAPATALPTMILMFRRRFRQRVTYLKFPSSTLPQQPWKSVINFCYIKHVLILCIHFLKRLNNC